MNPDQPATTQTPTVTQVPSTTPLVNNSHKVPLIILGILEAVFPILALYILFTLIGLQNSIESNSITAYFGAIYFLLALIIALTQLIVGIFSLDVKLGPQKTKFLLISGAILGALAIPAMVFFVIAPIYDTIKILQ